MSDSAQAYNALNQAVEKVGEFGNNADVAGIERESRVLIARRMRQIIRPMFNLSRAYLDPNGSEVPTCKVRSYTERAKDRYREASDLINGATASTNDEAAQNAQQLCGAAIPEKLNAITSITEQVDGRYRKISEHLGSVLALIGEIEGDADALQEGATGVRELTIQTVASIHTYQGRML